MNRYVEEMVYSEFIEYVIQDAIKQYARAKRKLMRDPTDIQANVIVIETEKFFERENLFTQYLNYSHEMWERAKRFLEENNYKVVSQCDK